MQHLQEQDSQKDDDIFNRKSTILDTFRSFLLNSCLTHNRVGVKTTQIRMAYFSSTFRQIPSAFDNPFHTSKSN